MLPAAEISSGGNSGKTLLPVFAFGPVADGADGNAELHAGVGGAALLVQLAGTPLGLVGV